jgi:hemerythrin
MLFDSSGVNKDAARREHRDVIEACVHSSADADPLTVACALDWLLYDWLMAHREDPDSAAITFPKGHDSDAGMLVAAASTSVRTRAQFDPGLAVTR